MRTLFCLVSIKHRSYFNILCILIGLLLWLKEQKLISRGYPAAPVESKHHLAVRFLQWRDSLKYELICPWKLLLLSNGRKWHIHNLRDAPNDWVRYLYVANSQTRWYGLLLTYWTKHVRVWKIILPANRNIVKKPHAPQRYLMLAWICRQTDRQADIHADR